MNGRPGVRGGPAGCGGRCTNGGPTPWFTRSSRMDGAMLPTDN
ncbi:hypothetical protein TOK_4166 [Pseudonocardia sp. N23]|nr:hypothetical protein TOK_4166 [Pseudonocardia sp. N23]